MTKKNKNNNNKNSTQKKGGVFNLVEKVWEKHPTKPFPKRLTMHICTLENRKDIALANPAFPIYLNKKPIFPT